MVEKDKAWARIGQGGKGPGGGNWRVRRDRDRLCPGRCIDPQEKPTPEQDQDACVAPPLRSRCASLLVHADQAHSGLSPRVMVASTKGSAGHRRGSASSLITRTVAYSAYPSVTTGHPFHSLPPTPSSCPSRPLLPTLRIVPRREGRQTTRPQTGITQPRPDIYPLPHRRTSTLLDAPSTWLDDAVCHASVVRFWGTNRAPAFG